MKRWQNCISHLKWAWLLSLLCVGCTNRNSEVKSEADLLKNTGSVDGYNYEIYGHSTIRSEQIPDEKDGVTLKVTCGTNWFSIKDRWLVVNGKDYGNIIKRGDTIKVDADGTLFVNGNQKFALPTHPPAPVPNMGPDVP